MDSYDQQYFEKVYEQEPELMNFLDGFTWFTNAINVYPCTASSIRYLLTNQFYLNDRTITDWVAEGWASSDGYYQALRNNDFDISVYTSEDGAVSEEAKALFIKNAKKQQLRVASHTGLAKSLLRLTAIRYFPDVLKQYVWVSDYTSLFEPLKETEDASVYTWEDAVFYHGLVNQGLSPVENNQYHFIHLRGVHEPNSLLEDLTVAEDSRNAVTATEAIACLKILQEYCDQLKALGVYDSTCIVITADHGDYDRSMGTPIFLVKNLDSRGPLSVSDVPVSQQNLRATVAAALSLEDVQQYGVSVFDVTKENAEPRRYFRYDGIFGEHEPGYVSPIVEYAVQPENNLPESFVYTGKVYSPDGMHETIPYQCAVGEPIWFRTVEDLQYFISGVSSYVLKSKSVWITEREGKMRFVFGEEESDLICTISIDPYFTSGQQRLIVTHAGEEIYNNSVIGGTTEIRFSIPNRCIVNGVLELDFQCPDGLSMWELGLGQDSEAFLSFPLHQIIFTRAAG